MPTVRPYKVGKVPKPGRQPPHAHAMRSWQVAGDREYFRCTVCGFVRWYRVR